MRDTVDRTPEGIKIHRPEDFEGMRRAGRIAAETLDMIGPHVAPGVTTEHLDELIHDFITENGATPATLGYRGYTKSSCISINHVVCHGIPGPRALKDGDILNIDVTAIFEGWYGDTSRMYVAGKPDRKSARLIDVTHDSLMAGIAAVKPGARFADIGRAIQTHAEGERCSVVRDFCGHGLGLAFHEPPNILHYEAGPRDNHYQLQQVRLRPGMFFTIEPMVNLGRKDTKVLPDGWTAVTRDRKLSAQFEHSLGVTEDGVEIFTLSPKGRFHPFGLT